MKMPIFWLASAYLLSVSWFAHGQSTTPHFTINVFAKNVIKPPAISAPTSPALYEDEDYVVSAYCYGEFGGGLLFKNKRTDSTYTCQATCALNVIRLKGRYVVSCTLAHLTGFAQVLEIADPRQMKVLPRAKQKGVKRPKIVVAQGEPSMAGTKTLADSIGVQLSGSFSLNGRPYFIVTDWQKTYLTIAEAGRFLPVAKLADFSTWSYDPIVRKMPEGHYFFFYKNDKAQGYIDVYDNTINVYRYP